jgi:hypothetical protein
LGQQSRRSQATPNPKRILQRYSRLVSLGAVALGARARHVSFVALDGTSSYLAGLVGVRGLRLALNTAVAVLVLSLPFAATAASRASTVAIPAVGATTVASADASRAQPLARGGAIAVGHPLGASGAILMNRLLYELERRDLRYGLETMCCGGGIGTATIIDRVVE